MRFAILFLVACSSHATKPQDEPVTSPGSAALVTHADGQVATVDAARVVPKLDTACQGDGDCTLTSDTLEDFPPQTYACCPGCSQNAVSAASYKTFRAFCDATRPPMCPPIGCLMPQMRAVCEAGHCVAKDARPTAAPDVRP